MAKKITGSMNLEAAGATDIGQRRRINEDAFCVEPILGLLAVADGLGGHAAGEVASSLAISRLKQNLESRLSHDKQTSALELLAEAVKVGNSAIRKRIEGDPKYQGMATTLTACLVKGGCAYFAHVGDSRAYLLRDGQIAQLTEDHTVGALRLRKARSEILPRDRHVNQRLLSALGISPLVGMDLFTQDLRKDDMLLLCTDGLTSELSEGDLADTCQLSLSLPARVEKFLALANERGGQDNITVILATFQEGV